MLKLFHVYGTQRREMAERDIFMDTNVFTGIVGDIQSAAENLVLSDNALKNTSCLEGFNAGRQIIEALKSVHTSADLYRQEASISLPRALYTVRDSMIAVDNAASESLTVETKNAGGSLNESKK